MNIIYHEANEEGRDFAVGDIHGHYDELFKELAKVSFDFSIDRLFSVGDLCDRGPASFMCASLALESWFFPVLGNHELMLLSATHSNSREDYGLLYTNGGIWFDELDDSNKSFVRDIFKTLPVVRVVSTLSGKKVAIVHAEVQTDFETFENEINQVPRDFVEAGAYYINDALTQATWGRNVIRQARPGPCEGIDLLVHGHTPVAKSAQRDNRLYIDTGVFLPSGCLTIVELS